MKKIGIAAVAAVALMAGGAQSANAAVGPCATQQALFDKYNIQIDMYAPEVSWAYGTVCRTTG
jgi:hypothetical protein